MSDTGRMVSRPPDQPGHDAQPSGSRQVDLGTGALVSSKLVDVMVASPVSVAPDTPVRDAARIMDDRGISCVLVVEDERLVGLFTTGDLAGRVVAAGIDTGEPVSSVMTPEPVGLTADSLVLDAMLLMSEKGVGHLPVTGPGERPVGILTQTDLIRRQSFSPLFLINDIGRATDREALAALITRLHALVAQLVGVGVRAETTSQAITAVTDAMTRRLIDLGIARFGPPPVPFLWLACGSQGRREQTGVSDQDNCMILDDSYDPEIHGTYFRDLAVFVCDGLNACGFTYCPGEMMAMTDRWRQPAKVWHGYFEGWIRNPDPMAQMLASVMFDLRPIRGERSLFEGLQEKTVALARANSIFRAHMVSNALKHRPPLGFFGRLKVVRSGAHPNTIDMKHNGVVPITDLARIYALDAGLLEVGTRDRLAAASKAGSISRSGGAALLDAYELISELRFAHQAERVRAGLAPDNFLDPQSLSSLERKHLTDAFGEVRTLQSTLAQSRSA